MLVCILGFYLLGCALGFKPWVRILLGIALLFSSYNPILAAAGHDTKLLAIGTSAGLLAGIFYLLKEKWYKGMAIFTLFFALLFTSGHYQIIYYMLLLLGIMGISQLIFGGKQSIKGLFVAFGLAAIGAIVGVLPATQSVILIQDYTEHTMRGGRSELTINKKDKQINPTNGLDIEYAFKWSQGIGETFSLLIPNVCGPMNNSYYTVPQPKN
jgi:hypothetical protein